MIEIKDLDRWIDRWVAVMASTERLTDWLAERELDKDECHIWFREVEGEPCWEVKTPNGDTYYV